MIFKRSMSRDHERIQRRYKLDFTPKFVMNGKALTFRQTFEVFESPETYFRAPDDIVEQGRRLLDLDIVDTMAKLVHDNGTLRIGRCVIPLFALENGGRGRSLFMFRCVYGWCAAFLVVRMFSGVDKIKWILVACPTPATSHSSRPASPTAPA